MELKIHQAGEPVLRQQAKPLSSAEISSSATQQLIGQMRETLRESRGVGLAAPQVGFPVQLLVIEYPPEILEGLSRNIVEERGYSCVPFHVIINPTLRTGVAAGSATFFEGCLSVKGYSALVPRARSVVVECLNEKGERQSIAADGWYARILQHEIDHLQGTLYTDRMLARSLMTRDYYLSNWHTLSIGEAELSLLTTEMTEV